MKSIKKITVFYTDGTFEDIDKNQTIDLGKIHNPSFSMPVPTPIATPVPTNPVVNPNWWGGIPNVQAQAIMSPQPIGSARISTEGIQALTSAQISSLTVSSMSTITPGSEWK